MQVLETGPRIMTVERSARKKPVFVHLRVAPGYPKEEHDKIILLHFLEKMGCSGLLAVPWGVFDLPQLAIELIGEPDPAFEGSLRANLVYWTRDFWQTIYDFNEGDVKVAERMDEWTAREFLRRPNPKDGYNLRDLTDPEARIVIGFLNPIFHPEKPKKIVHK